jgi:hypothetical protein
MAILLIYFQLLIELMNFKFCMEIILYIFFVATSMIFHFSDIQDMSQNPPSQELVAQDLHKNNWSFRHIYRGLYYM